MVKEFPKCCECGKELGIGEHSYGNICRANETYCKECWDSVPEDKKKIIDWHFSCDWL